MRLLDSAILSDKGVTFGAIAAKDLGAVEGKIKAFGKGQARVRKEANLEISVCPQEGCSDRRRNSPHLCFLGPMSWPMPSYYTKVSYKIPLPSVRGDDDTADETYASMIMRQEPR